MGNILVATQWIVESTPSVTGLMTVDAEQQEYRVATCFDSGHENAVSELKVSPNLYAHD